MKTKQFVKGASVLSLGQIVIAACTFFRNIIIARMISVEDYGIATTLAVTLAMIEMTSNLAFDKMLIQDKDGDSDEFLASAHLLQFCKSLFTGLLLFLAAPLMASFFGLNEIAWAYQLLALIPIIQGFVHFDAVTYQRNMVFSPTATIDAVPQIVTMAVAYPIALFLNDYRAMLTLVILQPFTTTILSHVFARRPYRWTINRELLIKKVNFGWPLMINGLLMFAVFNGDKTIIGNKYGMETLGWYGAVFALTMMPALLFTRICSTLLLPPLSKNRDNNHLFSNYCTNSTIMCFALGLFNWCFFTFAGTAVIFLSYGEKYIMGAQIVSWLALMQSIRIIRIAPTIIATSLADTKNAMIANIVRVMALPPAAYFAYEGYPIVWMIYVAIGGEVLATITSLIRLKVPNKTHYIKSFTIVSLIFSAVVIIGLLIAFNLDSAIPSIFGAISDTLAALFLSILISLSLLMTNSKIRTVLIQISAIPIKKLKNQQLMEK